jgi:hypothetical protein
MVLFALAICTQCLTSFIFETTVALWWMEPTKANSSIQCRSQIWRMTQGKRWASIHPQQGMIEYATRSPSFCLQRWATFMNGLQSKLNKHLLLFHRFEIWTIPELFLFLVWITWRFHGALPSLSGHNSGHRSPERSPQTLERRAKESNCNCHVPTNLVEFARCELFWTRNAKASR